MGLDDGIAGFDDISMKARLESAMKVEAVSFKELCERAGLAEEEALAALHEGTDGLPRTLPVLQKLSLSLGRDLNWLVTGVDTTPRSPAQSIRERVQRLLSEYIRRAKLNAEQRRPLVMHIERLLEQNACSTPQAAFRRGLPQSVKDVAWIHMRLP